MDKRAIHTALCETLAHQLRELRTSAAAAREGATHEEAKPENQYDTRALEQSYLAGAQAARVENLAAEVSFVDGFELPRLTGADPIVIGACVVVVDDDEEERRYYLCGAGGGIKLAVEGKTWMVVTPSSPLGQRLMGRAVGDMIEHVARGVRSELEIISVN